MSTKTKVDFDYTAGKVAQVGRKSNLSMFMIMLGFTFFSASMWVGSLGHLPGIILGRELLTSL